MLYTKIRHVKTIRILYRLRNILLFENRPEISTRLGFTKFSGHYYRLIKKLQAEKILDGNGRFIDSITNSWLAELPLTVASNQLNAMGNKIPYVIYLALMIGRSTALSRIIKELFLTRSSAYNASNKLIASGLVEKSDSEFLIKNNSFHMWLRRYLQLCKTHADIKNDISILFDTVPAYVDGEQAYYLVNYKAGRPIGPANIVIRTYEPFLSFWNGAINEVRYFKEYPKDIQLKTITKSDRIQWLNEIPYNKNATITEGA
jgi:predicted transcriptional regulator